MKNIHIIVLDANEASALFQPEGFTLILANQEIVIKAESLQEVKQVAPEVKELVRGKRGKQIKVVWSKPDERLKKAANGKTWSCKHCERPCKSPQGRSKHERYCKKKVS